MHIASQAQILTQSTGVLPGTSKDKPAVGEEDWADIEEEETSKQNDVTSKYVYTKDGVTHEIVSYNEENDCIVLSNGEVINNNHNIPKETIQEMIKARNKEVKNPNLQLQNKLKQQQMMLIETLQGIYLNKYDYADVEKRLFNENVISCCNTYSFWSSWTRFLSIRNQKVKT